MTFDPFRGYSDKEKNICNPDVHEGVKEVSLMDGAFIIREDGVILSGGRYISASVRGLTLPKGLGARACGGGGDYQIHPSYRPGCFRVNRNGPRF